MELPPHLFRRESGRIVAALTGLFGVHRLELVEDVVQEAFCRALEVWKVRGMPENPAAWLLATAKYRAVDVLRHERTALRLEPEVARSLEADLELESLLDEAFAVHTVRDAELRMMFSCCHPRLAEEAQLALILKLCCGFGVSEIASALFSTPAAIEKRIARSKQVLAASQQLFELDAADFGARLDTVRRALYLLFNEGFHGASAEAAVRVELCEEALRLTARLLEYGPASTPTTLALGALECLQAARLPARVNPAGELSALVDQDRRLWDARLLAEGFELFERSASGNELSAYHVESAIAATHASARSVAETDWGAIVDLYDRLMQIAPSPVVALNRAIALGQRDGAERGLEELGAIAGIETLARYPFYPAALAEFEARRGSTVAARAHFRRALALARNPSERHFLERRLHELGDA